MAHQFKVGDRVLVTGFWPKDYHELAGPQVISGFLGDSKIAEFEGHDKVAPVSALELAPALINPAKKYRTRDGRDVRIYATDGGWNNSPIHGAVMSDEGWEPEWWTADGHSSEGFECDRDLIEVNPEREYWLNIYSADIPASLYLTKRDADAAAAPDRIACIHVKFTEGEGLA